VGSSNCALYQRGRTQRNRQAHRDFDVLRELGAATHHDRRQPERHACIAVLEIVGRLEPQEACLEKSRIDVYRRVTRLVAIFVCEQSARLRDVESMKARLRLSRSVVETRRREHGHGSGLALGRREPGNRGRP
jgi:hypothetical protein